MKIKRILKVTIFSMGGLAGILLTLFASVGCSAMFPKKQNLEERLSSFPTTALPVAAPVEIRWDEHQIPFIYAKNKSDAAFALGLVHAHLRLAQMSLMKRLAQGRTSEIAGPFTAQVDQALLVLNLEKALPEMERALDADSRQWIERFVQGLNLYQERMRTVPPEFGLLGIQPEPWTVRDVLLISRLAAADVTWFKYITLLRMRGDPQFENLWKKTKSEQSSILDSAPSTKQAALLQSALLSYSRNGSNSFALSPSRSATGAALIANDPHLGLSLPNFWLLAGLETPEIKVVGMMIPGLPMFPLGRTESLAWGGTNMHSMSSDLVDVSHEELHVVEKEIKNRFWFNDTISVRESAYGRVITDVPFLSASDTSVPLALRWVGQEASSEITSFMKVLSAKNVTEFRSAFEGYAVSGQNMVAVDKDGNSIHVLAAKIPERKKLPENAPWYTTQEHAKHWQHMRGTMQLEYIQNPASGVIASANNQPEFSSLLLSFSYGDTDRVLRLRELLGEKDRYSVSDLKHMQRDVYSATALKLSHFFKEEITRHSNANEAVTLVRELSEWDGNYKATSRGALVFEVFLNAFLEEIYRDQDAMKKIAKRWSVITHALQEDYYKLEPTRRATIIKQALSKALEQSGRYQDWGDIHKVSVGFILQSAPVIGRFFTLDRYPSDGSRETLFKTAHGLVDSPHTASYGSQSRHVSDMSSPDENYFVLFGGQDGWLGSSTFSDQIALWKEGEYIQIPLNKVQVIKTFTRVLNLLPK